MATDDIARFLNEALHGQEDLDPRAIRKRVIEIIHQVTNNSYREVGMLPTPAVAGLLLEIWAHRTTAENENRAPPESPGIKREGLITMSIASQALPDVWHVEDGDGNIHEFASLAKAQTFANCHGYSEISHITNRRLVKSVKMSKEEVEVWKRARPDIINVVTVKETPRPAKRERRLRK